MILLVEDNPNDVKLTLRAFRKNNIGNEVVVANDGEEALDFLYCRGKFADRDPKVQPKIILLDLKLPKLDGLEVLRKIRANESTRWVPVIIMTSSKEESDLIGGYSNGANSYIQKPVDFNDFFEAVKALGLYWLVLNEQPPRVKNGW